MTYPYNPSHGWGPFLNDLLGEGKSAWSDQYQSSKHTGTFECCIVCGRRTTKDRGIAVLLGGGGDAMINPADADEAERMDPGFLGLWLVGPECGTAIPAKYRVQLPAGW